MGLFSSIYTNFKQDIGVIKKAVRPPKKSLVAKVGEGLEKGSVIQPGPTKQLAALPKNEPVSFSIDKSKQKISPAATASQTVRKVEEKPTLSLFQSFIASHADDPITQIRRGTFGGFVPGEQRTAKNIIRRAVKEGKLSGKDAGKVFAGVTIETQLEGDLLEAVKIAEKQADLASDAAFNFVGGMQNISAKAIKAIESKIARKLSKDETKAVYNYLKTLRSKGQALVDVTPDKPIFQNLLNEIKEPKKIGSMEIVPAKAESIIKNQAVVSQVNSTRDILDANIDDVYNSLRNEKFKPKPKGDVVAKYSEAQDILTKMEQGEATMNDVNRGRELLRLNRMEEIPGKSLTDEDLKIRNSVSKKDFESIVERFYPQVKEFYWDDGIKSYQDYLEKVDPRSIELELDSHYQTNRAIHDLLGDEEIGVDLVVDAYKNGILQDDIAKEAFKVNVEKPSDIAVKGKEKFFEPQKIKEDIQNIFVKAQQKMVGKNKKEIAKARKDLFVAWAIDRELATKLGMSPAELNKKIRSISGMPVEGAKIQQQINDGIPTQFQWHGISNSNFLKRSEVELSDIDKIVANISDRTAKLGSYQGDSLRHYIMNTFLSIDTRLRYDDLNFTIESLERALGQYSNKDISITIASQSQNTVAHEIGHYLDYRFGRELGMDGSLADANWNFEYLKEKHGLSDEHISWAKEYIKFVKNLMGKSEIGYDAKRSEYLNTPTEVFARFTARFVDWAASKSGFHHSELNYYNDKFSVNDFHDFIKLLQKKGEVDAKYNIKVLIKKGKEVVNKEMEPSLKADLEYRRNEAIEGRMQKEAEESQNIQAARQSDLSFSSHEREGGYQAFKKLADKSSKIREVEDEAALKAILKKRPEFAEVSAVDNTLFSGADDLTNDDLLQVFKDRYAEEKELAKLAKQKTPEEMAALRKAATQRIYNKHKVGKNLPVKKVIEKKAPVKTYTKAEDVLLKDKLKQQEVGAKYGFKAGWLDAKEYITKVLKNSFKLEVEALKRGQQLDTLKDNIIARDIKNRITEYIKAMLPVSEQGKFITMLKNAKTQRDITKAYLRVEEHANKYKLKVAISELKNKVKKLSESPSIDVEYAAKIKEVVENYELTGHTKKTMENLLATQQYLQAQKAQGKDVYLPEEVLRRLRILTRVPKDQITLEQVEALNAEIDILAQLGQTKLQARENVYNALKEARKAKLEESVVNMAPKDLKEAGIGESLSFKEKAINLYRKAYNLFQKKNMALTPMDGVAKVTGMEPMKAALDLDYTNYLNHELRTSVIKQREELLKKLKLNEENFERIGVYALKKQKGGYEKLLDNGISQEQADAIVLTSAETEYYNFVRKTFDDSFDDVKAYMKDVYNQDVGQVENYVSYITDFDAMSELEMYNRFGTLADEAYKTKKVNESFTKKRTGGKQKVQINIDKIFLRHTDDVAYMLTMGKDIKMYTEIINDPELQARMGETSALMWLQYLDLMARKGGVDGAKRIALLDTIRRNLGASVLPFKITSALVQLTSFADGASVLGGDYMFKGASRVASSKQWRKFVMDNFPEVRVAVGDDPAYLELTDSFLGNMADKGITPLKKMDALVRASTAAGAYEKLMAEAGKIVDLTNPDQAIIQAAQKLTRKSQGSSLFKDQPMAVTRGAFTGNKSLDKTIFQFQSFMLNRWDNIKDQIWRSGIKEGNYKQAFTGFFWLIVVAGALEYGIRQGYRRVESLVTGDDPKDEGLVKSIAMNGVESVPLVGSMMNSVAYDSNPVPAINAAENAMEGLGRIATGKKSSTKTKGAIEAFSSLGMLSGIPGSSEVGRIAPKFVGDSEKKEKSGLVTSGKLKLKKPGVNSKVSTLKLKKPQLTKF